MKIPLKKKKKTVFNLSTVRVVSHAVVFWLDKQRSSPKAELLGGALRERKTAAPCKKLK